MDNIFLFDVDGTLTEPRQEMTQDFANLFRVLVGNNLVYLVSGSDLAKLKEQVPKDILDSCAGIFSSSANQLDISDELIYINELEVEEGLEEFFRENDTLVSITHPFEVVKDFFVDSNQKSHPLLSFKRQSVIDNLEDILILARRLNREIEFLKVSDIISTYTNE